jgi:selenocysteine lyase/cysteine desulfurase
MPWASGDDLAEHFPRKPAGAYLDTASVGLVPKAVAAAVADCYDTLGSGICGSERWHAVTERARRLLAAEFGVAETAIAFMASTGEAMNAIARAIRWKPGDEVLVLADEFPSVLLPWLGLGDAARVVQVEPLAGDDRLGALFAAIGPRTRVVAVSHVSSFTGTLIDLDILGRACAEVGALLVCDGAQTAGAIPLSLDAVDFYIATGYKWLLAGFGIAVVVAKAASMQRLQPTLLGHGNIPPTPRLTYAHLNLAGVYALEAAATLRQQIGVEAIHARVAQLVARIYDTTAELGLRPAGRRELAAGIVSIADLPDARSAAEQLATADIVVAERRGYLRISPYFYTTDREVDDLLRALKGIENPS